MSGVSLRAGSSWSLCMVRETGIVLAAVLDLSVGSYRRVGTVLYKTISLAKQFRVQAG